ncbi:MAG: hypothetical protein ACR2L3_01385 [Actinomycetota bacterium]
MRKTLALAFTLALVTGGSATAASKRQVPQRATFEASGSIAISDVIDAWIAGPTSVTAREFSMDCGIPDSQGLDAFVVELSDEISRVPATVRLTGSDATGQYDAETLYFQSPRMLFYDSTCQPTSDSISDDRGRFEAGTAYVLVIPNVGAGIEFTLTAREVR